MLLFSQLGSGTYITNAKGIEGKVTIIGSWSIKDIDGILEFTNQDGMKFIIDPNKAHDSELISCDGQGHVSLNNIPLMLDDEILKEFGLKKHDEKIALERCLEHINCDSATIEACSFSFKPIHRYLVQVHTTEGERPRLEDGLFELSKGKHGICRLSISEQSGKVLLMAQGICKEMPHKIGDIELSPPTSRITVDYSRFYRFDDGAIAKFEKRSDRYDYELLGQKISCEAATYIIKDGKPVPIDEEDHE
jgi:hypothetical protein